MTIHRFLLAPDQFTSQSAPKQERLESGATTTIVEPQVVKQIKNVLRLRPGDAIVVGDGCGTLVQATIAAVSSTGITIKLGNEIPGTADPPVKVTVAMSLLKPDPFCWAVEKLTEIGADCLMPTYCQRTINRQPKLARWAAIAREAAEQCERAAIPRIVEPLSYKQCVEILTSSAKFGDVYICVERPIDLAPLPLLSRALSPRVKPLPDPKVKPPAASQSLAPPAVAVLIGPEGGLTDEEIALAYKLGCKPVSLGPRILRAETAALYAASQIIWTYETNAEEFSANSPPQT